MDSNAQIVSVVAVAVLLGALLFKAQVGAVLGRLTKLNFPGGSAEIGEAKASKQVEAQQKGGELAPVPALAAKPPPDAFLDTWAENLATAIKGAAPNSLDGQLAWALRFAATAQVQHRHEQVYRYIFGSQLRVLKQANINSQTTIGEARKIYAEAVEKYPDFYSQFSFDSWIGFLLNQQLARPAEGHLNDGTAVFLTPAGKSFLVYLTTWGLTEEKVG